MVPPYIDIGIPWRDNEHFFRTKTATGVRAIVHTFPVCYLWEVNVIVGHVLRLVVVVSRVCYACVILLHGLVLREGRLFGLQLRMHHVAVHQGLGPTRHGL